MRLYAVPTHTTASPTAVVRGVHGATAGADPEERGRVALERRTRGLQRTVTAWCSRELPEPSGADSQGVESRPGCTLANPDRPTGQPDPGLAAGRRPESRTHPATATARHPERSTVDLRSLAIGPQPHGR